MRSILRFIFLNLFIFSFVGCIELLLIQFQFSSPAKLKTVLSESNVYQDLSGIVNEKLQEMEEPVDFVVSVSMIQPVVETVIDDTWAWGSGKTTTPPSLSLQDIVLSAGIEGMSKTEIDTLQKELTEMISDPSIQKELPPEGKEAMKQIQNFGTSGGTISLAPLLLVVTSTVQVFQIGIPVLAVLAVVSVLMIVVISPNNQSRSMWLFFTFLFTSGAFLIAVGLFAVPKLLLPVLLAQVEQGSGYGDGVLRVIIGPLSNALFHQHLAIAVGVFCVAVVCLLARLMVFRSTPAEVVETKIQKKKKV